jgi:hypothetical protein
LAVSRRFLISSFGAASAGAFTCTSASRWVKAAVPPISQADHEKYMRLAMAESAHTREVVARGVNNSDYDPTLHVVAASPFYSGFLVGGILAAETDKTFQERRKK